MFFFCDYHDVGDFACLLKNNFLILPFTLVKLIVAFFMANLFSKNYSRTFVNTIVSLSYAGIQCCTSTSNSVNGGAKLCTYGGIKVYT